MIRPSNRSLIVVFLMGMTLSFVRADAQQESQGAQTGARETAREGTGSWRGSDPDDGDPDGSRNAADAPIEDGTEE